MAFPHGQVYKTLVTVGKTGAHYVFVIPIASEIDFKKAARAVGEKSVEMLPPKRPDKGDGLCPRRLYVHWDEEAVPHGDPGGC